MHDVWCSEYAEFETVWKRKDVEEIKAFLSTRVDKFRAPYGRQVKRYPRRSVIVATANGNELLHDPTGDRRFWVIPVKGEVPIELLEHERDLIWCAAIAAYRSGEKWYLGKDEQQDANRNNESYQSTDAWLELIENAVDGRPYINLSDLIERALEIPAKNQDNKTHVRVKNILRRLGYEPTDKRQIVSGKRLRLWENKSLVAIADGHSGQLFQESSNSNTSSMTTALTTLPDHSKEAVIAGQPLQNFDLPTIIPVTSAGQGSGQGSGHAQTLMQQSSEQPMTTVTTAKLDTLPVRKINIGSVVKHKDKRYPGAFKVEGYDSHKRQWHIIPMGMQFKGTSDLLYVNENQLTVID